MTKKIIDFESPRYSINKLLLHDPKNFNQIFKIYAHILISLFIHSLIHFFNKHTLCTLAHVSGTMPNAEPAEVNEIWCLSSRFALLMWEGNKHRWSLWARWQKHRSISHIWNGRKCMKTTNLWLEKGEFLSPFFKKRIWGRYCSFSCIEN